MNTCNCVSPPNTPHPSPSPLLYHPAWRTLQALRLVQGHLGGDDDNVVVVVVVIGVGVVMTVMMVIKCFQMIKVFHISCCYPYDSSVS